MTDIDAKVNMSLDEIIKMEKKEKKRKPVTTNGKGGAPRIRPPGNGNVARGRGRAGRSGKQTAAAGNQKKGQAWRLQRNQNNVQGGFVKKRYNKNNPGTLVRSRSNISLNRIGAVPKNVSSVRGGFISRRGRGGRYTLNRTKNRTNLTFAQGGFFTGAKGLLKRTNSMPNLRDPTSVHNRLGYQSPAQVAYRNRVKRATQLLLQRQNQRQNLSNEFRVPQAGKPLTTLQQRALERRQQILTSQRRFNTGGLRSDQILRAQRRAQYEQKLMRMNTARMNTNSNVNFMCTLGNEYSPGIRQRSLSLSQNQTGSMNNLRQLPRGRSPITQTVQNLNMVGRSPMFGRQHARSRSRSRSRTRNIPANDSREKVDDRTFSEMIYSISYNLGVTGRTLNDRFSF
ncbi:uncharacterized protein LOC107274820 isoform X2 [Cephus cinctus]|uniref:Uncharacterized protein LOC107274820 isoform X2 n=1 Tax=Cephus cinctus TaxID=211228 RepID=A0AAJ7CFV2_CEPCN|nr:uncharacterized protein LOC107274820 isoform X2 [Cephus cinctus]